MKGYRVSSCFLFVSIIGLGNPAFAGDQHHGDGKHKVNKSMHEHNDGKNAHSHQPVAHWFTLLSKQQKREVDRMHHQLHEDQEEFKKKEKLKQDELNKLSIKDDVDLLEINNKIDELMAAKNKILRLRHEHLVEMRRILNIEQRVSYDAEILKRNKIK